MPPQSQGRDALGCPRAVVLSDAHAWTICICCSISGCGAAGGGQNGPEGAVGHCGKAAGGTKGGAGHA